MFIRQYSGHELILRIGWCRRNIPDNSYRDTEEIYYNNLFYCYIIEFTVKMSDNIRSSNI